MERLNGYTFSRIVAGLAHLEAEGLARHLVGTTELRVSFVIRALFNCEGLITAQLGHEAALRAHGSSDRTRPRPHR